MAKKYYAVKNGRNTGIFLSWKECKEQVIGYKNAIYKSFLTLEEAKVFLEKSEADSKDEEKNKITYHENEQDIQDQIKNDKTMIAYIDGSYDVKSGDFSYGGVMFTKLGKRTFSKRSKDERVSSMRNVAGEVNAAMYVMQEALDLGIETLYIYYDYSGIECWAKGEWKTNNILTQGYKKYCDGIKKDLTVHFCKVKSHANVKYNEMADKLAKKALGKS